MNLIFNLFFFILIKRGNLLSSQLIKLLFVLLFTPQTFLRNRRCTVPPQCLCFMETSNLTSIGKYAMYIYVIVADHCVSIYQKVFLNGVFDLVPQLVCFEEFTIEIVPPQPSYLYILHLWRPFFYIVQSDISTLTVRVCLAPPGFQFSLGGVKPDEEGRPSWFASRISNELIISKNEIYEIFSM